MANKNGSVFRAALPVQTYAYLPLQQPLEIRLLKVSSADQISYSYEITHAMLGGGPSFQAVSYVWGDSNKNFSLAFSNGTHIDITQTLAEAIPYLSQHCSSGYLWIDQICISQNNIPERNEQVKMMGEIYRTSFAALIWLGEVEDLDPMAQEVFQPAPISEGISEGQPETYAIASINRLLVMDIPKSEITWQRMLRILRRPWFTRAWIVQEAVLPPVAYAIFGSTAILIPALLLGLDLFLQAYESKLARQTDFAVRTIYAAWFDRVAKIPSPFHELLSRMTEVSKATDDRDLVYAFLGLQSELEINIYPDYSATIETIFTDSAAAIIRGSCSLDIFRTLSEYNLHSSPLIPSWAPDWRGEKRCFAIHGRLGLMPPSRTPMACQGRQHVYRDLGPRNLLAVKGKIIDSVRKNIAPPFRMHTQNWEELNISDYLNVDATFELSKQRAVPQAKS